MSKTWLALAWIAVWGCGTAPEWLESLPAPPAQVFDRETSAILNFHRVEDPERPWLRLYRSGQPAPTDWAQLAKLGITVDINLLDPDGKDAPLVTDEVAATARFGIRFVNLPLPWGIAPPEPMVQTFLETVARSKGQGVLVHCKHGKDRTGEMVAAWRIFADGYTFDEAMQEMYRYGHDPKPFPWVTQFVFDFARQRHR